MIPKIFDSSATSWSTEGLGRLSDALSCSVKEKLNGEYTATLVYPVDGVNNESLVAGAQLVTTPAYGRDPEPFDVTDVTTTMDGKKQVKAQHISYRLSKIPTMPCSGGSASEALTAIKTNAAQTCAFTFYTDKATSGTYTQIVPASIRSRLGGVRGSILDVYGGEYEWTKFRVDLWNRRGIDRGVTIRYGKNLIDAKQEKSIANTVTGICPYWSKEEDGVVETVTLPEKVLLAPTAVNYPYPMTRPVDLTSHFEDKPSVADLRSDAQAYLAANVTGIPAVNITVSFVQLWETEQYANIAPLEQVQLGDTVHVYFEELDINATARVIETDWDALRNRYNSITLGDVKNTITDRIVDNSKALANMKDLLNQDLAQTESHLMAAINTATAAITGQNGGHVYFGLGSDGEPNELYIMDTADVSTARKVWRYNLAGWGVSTTGVNGPYTMAATLESGIVANIITAGTMLADRIKGGTLELGGDNNTNGILVVKDSQGNTVVTLDKDGASIVGSIYNLFASTGYYVDIQNGKMAVGDITHGEAGYIDGTWYFNGTTYEGRLSLKGTNGIVLDADDIYTRESGSVNMKGGSGNLTVNGATITFQNGLMITDIL